LNNPTTAKPSLRHRATEELREFLILGVYLYVCLGAIIIMKSAILNGVGVEFDVWGIAAVKALLLAKFMLIGKALRLGEKKNKPLAWPTLYQSLLTLLLLIVLTALEEILVGAIHHRTVIESLVIAHPALGSSSTAVLADRTKRTVSRTEAPFAFAVLTTERKAA
jgi:hypothetical protein